MVNSTTFQLTGWQKFFFVLLRLSIGWHFLREGVVKLANPAWSAKGYMLGAWGPVSPMLEKVAQTGWMMNTADILMPWMLTLAGIGLLFGIFTRTSTVLAMLLLAVFYFSAPPWPIQMVPNPISEWGPFYSWIDHAVWAGKHELGSEGNYVFVNKNLIEFIALAALLTTNSGFICGFDGLIHQWFGPKENAAPPVDVQIQTVE